MKDSTVRRFEELEHREGDHVVNPEPNDYAGRDYPIEGDPGWDIDQWDAQITEPLPVVQP